jgi:UDP-GlcNAc:undecaprenyl-phosphate/decaprenyl-phosphate GlcNAc-1-phosphate transferase
MKSYFLLFTLSLLLALLLTPLVRRWAVQWGAVDLPDERRRIHERPTPRLGGLAVFLAALSALAIVPWLNNILSQNMSSRWSSLGLLVAPAVLVFLLGVLDDFRGLNALVKTSVEVLAAGLLYTSGFGINSISLPFGGSWEFPLWLSFPLTALWVVGITNAFNLIDGIDGLAAGASIFALLTLFITSLMNGHTDICVVSIVLIGAVMGFLRYNFNPASIFLGDSGALFLGFMCAALSLISAQKSSTIIAVAIPLVSFGFPITEVGLSMVRRFLSGAPIFQSDRRHIHHMLLKRGLNQRQAAILLYGVCALFSLFGIMLLSPGRNRLALIFGIIGVCLIFGVQHLRYAEFGILSDHFKRGVKLRRRAVAIDLQLRQAADSLHQVNNYSELSATLNQLFATSEFDCVLLEVYHQAPRTPGLQAELPAHTGLTGGNGHTSLRPAPNRVEWSWNWQNEKMELAEVLSSPHFWSLRVPLADGQGGPLGAVTFFRHVLASDLAVDLTKICGAIRQELSAALERIERQSQTETPQPQVSQQLLFSRS